MLDTFARSSHQSTGFLQSAGSKSLNMPRNPSSTDVTDTAHKVLIFCSQSNIHSNMYIHIIAIFPLNLS